ncbi:MAG TPA: hypothetical protein DDW87_13710 [Firmicutes bacterium]|nr:hypothetical protein [Bacillota bacterium]
MSYLRSIGQALIANDNPILTQATVKARILDLLFQDIHEETVTLEDFQRYAKDHAKAFGAFWIGWVKDVKEAAQGRDFFDTGAKKVLWFLIPSIFLVILAIIAFAFEMYFTGAISFIMGPVLIIVVATAASLRSAQGHEEYTRWRAFRRYLKESSRVDLARIGSLGIWETFLPYAVSLGVADQMLKQLEVRFPNLQQEGYQFGGHWFLYYHAAGLDRVGHMTTKVGESVTRVTMPQGSGGTGGGFSGGGGGGFGGGGGVR